MIICRTPFRISFFGGGTDYPSWFKKYGGAVLATTIDKYCYLTCRFLPPFFEHRYRVVYRNIETCREVDEIQHPVVRETLNHLGFERGIELHHDGDLPARSGMGSSSAFTVGLLHTLYALRGEMRSKMQLARESIHIEQELLRETVGVQDQVMTAFGGFKHAQFYPDGEIYVDPIPLPPGRLMELQSYFMLFYTGIARTASNVAESYVVHLEHKKQQLQTMRRLVDESIDLLISGADIRAFGALLDEAWQSKKSLSRAVSTPRVDALYDKARSAGAIGGKLTGAGGGGFMLLFVPPENQPRVLEALGELIHVPFKFESSGSQIIFYEPEVDYEEVEEARSKQRVKLEELSHAG